MVVDEDVLIANSRKKIIDDLTAELSYSAIPPDVLLMLSKLPKKDKEVLKEKFVSTMGSAGMKEILLGLELGYLSEDDVKFILDVKKILPMDLQAVLMAYRMNKDCKDDVVVVMTMPYSTTYKNKDYIMERFGVIMKTPDEIMDSEKKKVI